MKAQQRFWIRIIDGFLPKNHGKFSVIELYRSRALVRTTILGALLNPFCFLFESSAFDLWQKVAITVGLMAAPCLLTLFYRSSGRLRFCASLYVVYCTALCLVAQLTANSVYALYWIWIPFLIVFAVLVIGVREGAFYTVLAGLAFWWVLRDGAASGHTVGRFLNKDALLSSMMVQVVCIQLCFIMLMTAYDAIRNRAEVRAVLLRFTDDEAARLATVGERMGSMAQDLTGELKQFQELLAQLEGLAKRSDTRVEDLQKQVRELQEKTQKISEISYRTQG